MNDLTVGHVTESVTEQELRLFLRLFYKSPLSSKSDLLFIFPSPSHSSAFRSVIFQETESFFKLVNRTQFFKPPGSTSFDDGREFLNKEKEKGETIWGRGVRRDNLTESTRASYGSVVGFVVDELDPENSLSGFLDHVPMSMRRWACYPMLLGRVRRNFKHVVLVDVKEVLLLGDPLSRIRNRSPESVHLLSTEAGGAHNTNKQHGKRNAAKTQSRKPVNSAVVMGGARGVRRLSNTMLTEIVRVTTQHKKKNSVTESGLFNQLVGNEYILKNVNVVTSAESIPDLSSLTGLNSNSGSSLSLSNYTMLRRGNSNSDSTSIIMKHVCGLELNSPVYSDCL
ncbi:hypothetical protein RHSIM_Rhsim03G0025000 [Rhododendron simsii]|uniref:DUF7780 domain-containing protein n=1 Tax=Rhododendron simsii TaxID=118357 RepID=A0A834HAT8_RHOSS|nr:hypothetical protein RHSIM_Rhsim03G0025000 [Rhododendron simsii]